MFYNTVFAFQQLELIYCSVCSWVLKVHLFLHAAGSSNSRTMYWCCLQSWTTACTAACSALAASALTTVFVCCPDCV
jgi:hypothetical protein